MIVGSLLLILVAAGLVVVGLIQASNVLLISAIALCGVAAVLVYLGSRQQINPTSATRPVKTAPITEPISEAPTDGEPEETPPPAGDYARRLRQAERLAAAQTVEPNWLAHGAPEPPSGDVLTIDSAPEPVVEETRPAVVPSGHVGGSAFTGSANPATPDLEDETPDHAVDPNDEPAAERISPAIQARLTGSAAPVLVVDGRPRYHLRGCSHLAQRDSEPLSVGEAQGLGFTPCALCEPAATLARLS